jgi:nicotinate-nucleotide adenylyltransferase
VSAIGIFGGTFDPIHLGHLRSAWEVTHQLALTQLYFVPNAQTVHRNQPNLSFADRAKMVELAIAGIQGWSISRCEGDRCGASYSYDTLRHFRDQVGAETPIWLIVGSDAYRHFHQWHRWSEILDLCHLAVMSRAGEPVIGGCAETQAKLDHDQCAAKVGRVVPVRVTALAISSSLIRAELSAGRSPRFLVPETVLTYLHREEKRQSPAEQD